MTRRFTGSETKFSNIPPGGEVKFPQDDIPLEDYKFGYSGAQVDIVIEDVGSAQIKFNNEGVMINNQTQWDGNIDKNFEIKASRIPGGEVLNITIKNRDVPSISPR